MKRIATITTHSALNYGAVLQAYALNAFLNEAGYHCEVLDYQPDYVKKSYSIVKSPHSIQDIILNGFQLLHYRERKTRKERFESFRENRLIMTYEKASNKDEVISLANEFDLLICGSDQIWNPKLHGFDETYFLSYPEIKTKKISYAASFGQDSLDENSKKEISKRIIGIERFGCRETSAQILIKELSGRDGVLVLDPVFLLSADRWREMKKESLCGKKYVLAYFLSNPGKSIKAAVNYAEKIGTKVCSIGFSPRDVGNHADCYYDLGPQEFLDAIDGATTIITNSFHATAFSIIFHKQFFVRLNESKDSRNDRILTLLKMLGLENRAFTDNNADKVDFFQSIDYESVDQKLLELVMKSQEFLTDSVETIVDSDDKMIRITDNPCTACGACASACTLNCIEMKLNQDGFYMPIVDITKCVSCGACMRVCPANKRLNGRDWHKGEYYAMWAKNHKTRKEGSSGGIFGLLAERILMQEGVVFGAAFSDDCKSVYMTNTEDVSLSDLKKSKYVESKTGIIYREVKRLLLNGQKVLYCGTSCQIDGLKNYLQKDFENLVTCDFLCHGVSAAGLFSKYVSDMEQRYGRVKSISFRSKYYGWKAYCVKAEIDTGFQYIKTRFQDPYLRLFFENVGLRECCFSCHRLENSNADITIGDYWRVKESPDIPDTNEGISLVGVHTERGREWLASITDQCEVFQLEKERYEYAYMRTKYHIENQKIHLRKLYRTESMFEMPISQRTKFNGKLYQIRAQVQKHRVGRQR